MIKKLFRSRRSKAKLFSYIDCFFPKVRSKFLFVVKDRTYFSGNLRVMLETYLLHSEANIYIYKDGILSPRLKKELETLGVTILHGFNPYSIWHILTSGIIIFSHAPRDAHITKKCKRRKIINLWHGVAFKTIELLMPNIDKQKLSLLKKNSKLYDMLIASSEQDKITNANAFGVPLDKVHITGLPRYEILKKDYTLGTVLQEEEEKIKKIKGDKKLVLFAPTFRENNVSAIKQISSEEWILLQVFAKQNNILIGIRPHPYDVKHLPEIIKDSNHFCLFENSEFTEVNLLLKHTDILIVDFSSIWIDYLLLHKPIVGFAKDYEWYLHKERGFVYDFDSVFPDTFTMNIKLLIKVLKEKLQCTSPVVYKDALNKFHAYTLEYDYAKAIYRKLETMWV